MKKVGTIIVFLSALLCGTVTALTSEAGKCKPCNYTAIPLNMDGLVSLKPWRLLYATGGAAPFDQVDNELRDGYRLGDNLVRIVGRRRMADNSEGTYEFTGSIIDNVAVEVSYDKKGNIQTFYDHFLTVTNEAALLMYHCSHDGVAVVDFRYIRIPANRTLSDSGLQQLMDADSRCNFKGKLHKLPEILHKPKL